LLSLLKKLISLGLLLLYVTVNLIGQKLANDDFDGFKSLSLVKVVFNGKTVMSLQHLHHVLGLNSVLRRGYSCHQVTHVAIQQTIKQGFEDATPRNDLKISGIAKVVINVGLPPNPIEKASNHD
jgi:hypothetical protein